MELDIDFEPPEKRVLTWLSQAETLPASFESIIRNYSEPPDASLSGFGKTCGSMSKEVSEVGDSSNHEPKVSKPSTYKKSGLKKYFEINDSELSSVASESESLESSRCNRLYCYAERKSIVKYIVKRKLFSFVKGNYIWKQMEKERICARTWQSMKAQFHRYISQHLGEFALTEEDRNCFMKCMERSPNKKSPRFLSACQRGWRKNCKFYTFVEDALILYYVLEKNRYELTHGNAVWKKFEHQNIVAGRTWHSVKSRYKNFLSKYVERFAPINKQAGKLFQRRLDSTKKSEILHDFLLDHLLAIAISVNCISESDRNEKELKHIGLDTSFTIPFPRNKEGIKQCALKIVKQFSEKIDMLLLFSHDITENCREIIDVLPAKYSSMTDDLNLTIDAPATNTGKFDVDHGNGKNNVSNKSIKHTIDKCDLSDSVQQQLTISTPIRCTKQLFQSSFESNAFEQSFTMYDDEKPCASSIKVGSPKSIISEKDAIFTDEMQSDDLSFQSNAGTCASDLHFIDSQTLNDDVQFPSEKKTHELPHFSSYMDKTETEVVTCPEASVETSSAYGILDQNKTSIVTSCKDEQNELSQQEEINASDTCNDTSEDEDENHSSSCTLMNVSENIPEGNMIECLEMCIDDSSSLPPEEPSAPDSESLIEMKSDSEDSVIEVEKEDPIVNSDTVSCRLFDIPYIGEKNNSLYSSLLESILENKGKNFRKKNDNSLLEYYITTKEEPNSEIIKAPLTEEAKDSGSLKTIFESVCKSKEDKEDELKLRLESEEESDGEN